MNVSLIPYEYLMFASCYLFHPSCWRRPGQSWSHAFLFLRKGRSLTSRPPKAKLRNEALHCSRLPEGGKKLGHRYWEKKPPTCSNCHFEGHTRTQCRKMLTPFSNSAYTRSWFFLALQIPPGARIARFPAITTVRASQAHRTKCQFMLYTASRQ